jgi:formiminotetrahydrofolate cyclodeaminase
VTDAGAGSAAGAGSSGFGYQSVSELLDALAARTPAPGGGSAAALALAMAAALSAMAARYSEGQLDAAGEIAEAAECVRARALQLAEEDAGAYTAVLAARRLPADRSADSGSVAVEGVVAGGEAAGGEAAGGQASGGEAAGGEAARGEAAGGERAEAVEAAMARAIAIPLEVAELASEVGRLAGVLAASGNPNLAGDARTALLLADSAGAAALMLAELNRAEAAAGSDS